MGWAEAWNENREARRCFSARRQKRSTGEDRSYGKRNSQSRRDSAADQTQPEHSPLRPRTGNFRPGQRGSGEEQRQRRSAKIGIEDFAKVELRVGVVKSAERIQGADKLLKLLVDIGDEVRQVLAGIALAYTPEELVGRKVVIVANLAPRKMRGLESNGMLLAASVGPDGKPVLCTFAEDVPAGAKVK